MISVMQRDPHSHKGDNGKVAVIGGSRHQHGAPLFSALAAEASGVDLVYTVLPNCHEEVSKQTSLNFQVHAMSGDDLSKKDVDPILALLATVDCAVIGPGIARTKECVEVLHDIVGSAMCDLVLDATALQPWTMSEAKTKRMIMTPHAAELERMQLIVGQLQISLKDSPSILLLKGNEDTIFSTDKKETVAGGNAGLTVGGTGDALAGLIAGLLAQGMDAFDACKTASTIVKRAADELLPEYGYAFTTREVIARIPHLLTTLK